MWKFVTVQTSHSSCLFVSFASMMALLFFVATLPTSSHCLPLNNPGSGSTSSSSSNSQSTADLSAGVVDLAQLHNLLREAINYIHKINSNNNFNNKGVGIGGAEPTRISGQVNLRYPRSEIGDVALRLWNLQEMDRKYGAKARPRFGKRNEVTQDNFIPMYGDEELKDSTLGVTGDGYPVAQPVIFIP